MAIDRVRQLVSDPIDLTREDDGTADDNDNENDYDSGCPLPGFDPRINCALCRLYGRDTAIVNPVGSESGSGVGSSSSSSSSSEFDATLLKELICKFHQIKLASRPALIEAYAHKFREIGQTQPGLAFLANVTDEEVWRHYDEDHDECAHQFRDPMREVERTLQHVLHQAPLTLCVELKKGPNRGMRVVHPGRLRSYLDVVKTYTQLFPKTNQ